MKYPQNIFIDYKGNEWLISGNILGKINGESEFNKWFKRSDKIEKDILEVVSHNIIETE